MSQHPDAALQYGPPKTAADVAGLIGDRLRSVIKHRDNPNGPTVGVTVEFITTDPYTNALGVVTAVGVKYDDVLLTVEPKNQWTESKRLAELQRVLEDNLSLLDQTVDTRVLAGRLLAAGVLPTRDF